MKQAPKQLFFGLLAFFKTYLFISIFYTYLLIEKVQFFHAETNGLITKKLKRLLIEINKLE